MYLSVHIFILISSKLIGIFLLIFIFQYNKEKQAAYIKYHYNSLSSRFQLRENVNSIRLLLPMIFAHFIIILTFMVTDLSYLYWEQGDKNRHQLFYKVKTVFKFRYIFTGIYELIISVIRRFSTIEHNYTTYNFT